MQQSLVASNSPQQRFFRIESIRKRSLTPMEYLLRWVPALYGVRPNDPKKFRQKSIQELARLYPYSCVDSIRKNWGKEYENAPEALGVILRQADIINQISLEYEMPDHFPRP